MADFDNTNRGSVWKNNKKTTENHPDFTGSINVEGKEFWVSAWKRKPDANPKAPVLSFSIQPKEPYVNPAKETADTGAAGDPFGDDIPFAQAPSGHCFS